MNNKERYRSLTSLLRNLPVFFQPWWLDCVCPAWEVALAEDQGGIQGVWPYCAEQKLGFRLLRNPLLTPYLGPVFLYPSRKPEGYGLAAWEEKVFSCLWEQLPETDALDVHCTPAFSNFLLFHHKGCRNSNRITYHIALNRDESSLLSAMHPNYRNLIRQSEKQHTVLEGLQHIPGLAALHRSTYRRKQKKYPYPEALLQELAEAAYRQNSGNIYALCDASGKLSAGIFTVKDQETMYLLISAMDTAAAHPGAVRQLVWHAIREARREGLKTFDFEGSMDPGIEVFFRRFGGERKTYLSLHRYTSRLWKLKKFLLG